MPKPQMEGNAMTHLLIETAGTHHWWWYISYAFFAPASPYLLRWV